MIKIEHVVLPSPEQMEFVIEGMRNPMNSWDKSDSAVGCYIDENDNICQGHKVGDFTKCDECGWCEPLCYGMPEKMSYKVGLNDLDLMGRLAAAGTDHRKFMRMMPVMVRITAPLYWWKEFDTYKVGTVANSCSTMHKIADKEFTLDDFSVDNLYGYSLRLFEDMVESLNCSRATYISAKDPELKKQYWWQMIQLLPTSYNQTRNVMLNYEALNNMYHARVNHKLDEWREFCNWIETLPYSELMTE